MHPVPPIRRAGHKAVLKRASPLFAKSGQHVAHHRHPRDTRRHRAACDRPANGQCHGVQGRDHAFRHEANLLLGCEENGAPPDKPGVKVSKQIERVRESAIAGSANRGQPWNLASRRNFTYLRAQAYRVTRRIVQRPARINRPSSPSVILSIPVDSSSCAVRQHSTSPWQSSISAPPASASAKCSETLNKAAHVVGTRGTTLNVLAHLTCPSSHACGTICPTASENMRIRLPLPR